MIKKKKIDKFFKFLIVAVLLCTLMISSISVAFADTDNTLSVVSLTINDVDIVENLTGKYVYEYNPETDDNDLKYFKYSYVASDFTVEFSDGAILNSNDDGEIFYDGRWYTLNYSDDQSYSNQWTVGTYTVSAELLGITTSFNVNVLPSPVAGIIINTTEILKDTNCYTVKEYNYETDKYDLEWTKYTFNNLSFTVIFKDGTEKTSNSDGFINYNGTPYKMYFESDQSYENQWDIGVYTITASILGFSSTANISIVSNPVKSIIFDAIDLYSNTNGNYETYTDTESGIDNTWYKYDYSQKIKYAITLIDGTILHSYNDGSIEYDGKWYNLNFEDDQSYNNQWDIGMHEVKASILDYDTSFFVNIVKSPIVDVIIDDLVLIENLSGNYTTDVNTDTGEESPQWYCYKYNNPNYKVVLNDGTILESNENNGVSINNEVYYLNIADNQSYENQWHLGTQKVQSEIFGFKKDFNVNIIKSPVINLSYDDVTRIENTGEYKTDELTGEKWYHYSYDITKAVVTLEDGTMLESENGYIIYKNQKYSIVTTDEQSADNQWSLGTYPAKAYVMGASTDFSVNIIKTPIKKFILNDIYIREGIDGYYSVDIDPDTGAFIAMWYKYYYSHSQYDDFIIEMKDGTVLDNAQHIYNLLAVPCIKYCDQVYYFSYIDDQSITNQWKYGKHKVKVSFMGFNSSFYVYVKKQEDPDTDCYGDINSDGFISINDVTLIQKHLAELEILDDKQIKLGDVNADGSVDIIDVTMIQKYIAEIDDTGLTGVLAII